MKINQIELPSNRKFGFSFSLIFLFISVISFLFDNLILSIALFILSVIFVVISVFFSKILQPINYLWMLFGVSIGKVVSPVILGLIYFLIFTPISIITRIFGRDELSLRTKNTESLWKNREDREISPESFKNQF
tara:strand:+ start:666 stop:1067 length:402 start_codon:yes stop_codon:yes gene_type:complete